MKNTYPILIVFLVFAYTLKAQKSSFSGIDSLISTKTEKPFNGVILIAQNGKTKYIKAQGYTDLESKNKLAPDSQFIIGSISKQFTAALILKEVENKKLDIHIPLAKYLPELKQDWKNNVTIHHLLAHTHGIKSLDEPTKFSPGTQYEYSQIGYDILAKILEKSSEDSFANLSQKMFKSCKMKNTFHPEIKKYTKLVKSYWEQSGSYTLVIPSEEKLPIAAGGFISTAEDLVLWNRCLQEKKLLKKETLDLMNSEKENTVRNHPVFGITKYGYGITVENKDNLLQLGQTGLFPGFVSMNFYFPETKTSVIVLENIAYDWHDLKKTFYYHTETLDLVKNIY